MGFRAIEPVQITGLNSAPDITFASGWTTNVNIASFTTIPAPATAVLFHAVNDSTSSRAMGIRHANNSSNVVAIGNFSGGRLSHFITTLEGASGSSFDFYTDSNTSVKFFVGGFFHELTVFEPQNRISNSTSTGSWQTKTINEVPTGTTYILNGSSVTISFPNNVWRDVGGSVQYPVHGYISFIKIDSNKQFQVNVSSSNALDIWGYTDKNWVQPVATLTGNTMSNTTWSATSAWFDYPYTYPNRTGVVVYQDDDGIQGWNASHTNFLRKKGSSWSIARAGNQPPSSLIVEPDASGTFQYWIESLSPNTGALTVATVFTETVPDYTLTDVNTTESVTAGQDGVIFTGRGLSSVNKIRITSNTRSVSKNVTSANSTTVISAIPTDSEFFNSNIPFGNVTFSVEVAGNAVANLAGTLFLSQQYGQHDIVNVSQNTNSNTIYFGQTPAIKVGDKIAHDARTQTYNWDTNIDSNGFVTISSVYSTQTDNLSYRIYSSDFEQWSTPGTVTIQSPYVNARANSSRVTKSADGKRYSRYTDGSGPRYTPTIIVRSQAELNSALSLSQAALSGQVIGVEYNTTPYTIGRLQLQNKNFNEKLIISSYGGRKPVFSDIDLDNTGPLTLDFLEVYRNTSLSTTDGLIKIRANTHDLLIERCQIHGAYFDPTVDYDVSTFVNINGIFGYGGTQSSNVEISNCEIYDCYVGLHMGAGGSYFRVIGNDVHDCYFDGLKFRSECSANSTQINWNTIYRIFGVDRGGAGQPHADGIQFVGLYNDLSGLEIIGNIIFLGNVNANGENQGIFCDLATSPTGQQAKFISPKIKGNLLIGGGTGYNRIAIRPVDSAVVIGNSIVTDNPTAGRSFGIRVGETFAGNTTSYGTHIIKNNSAITYNIGGSPTLLNNDTWTTASNSFSQRFTGPTFTGINSRTQALSAFSMKIGGSLDLNTNIGAVGSGYVDFVNRTIDTSME